MQTRACACGLFLALLLGSLGATTAWAGEPEDSNVDADLDQNIDHVVVILDGSGSMGALMGGAGTRMTAAKEALRSVLSRVPATTYVGLLVMSGSGKRSDWVYPLGRLNMEQFNSALAPLKPAGSTPLGTYLKRGADALLAKRKAAFGYGTYRLLVVTDGEASGNDEVAKVNRFTPEVMTRGITVDAIGVDMASTHTLATQVHSYRNARDPKSLAREISKLIAEVSDADTGSDVGESLFTVIAGLEIAVASKMLEGLSGSGNHPIGTVLPTPKVAEVTPPSAGTSTPSVPPGVTPAPGDDAQPSDEGSDNSFFLFLVLAVVGAGIYGLLKRSNG